MKSILELSEVKAYRYFMDSLHLFCQITHRLRQLIKSNFICHTRISFNDLMAKEIGVIMVESPTKI